jgi:colicin import membrane protein
VTPGDGRLSAPPAAGRDGGQGRVGPVAKSVLLHAGVVAVLAAGLWWPRDAAPPPQQLAIEAVVVDQATLEPRRGPPRPRPEPATAPAPEPERVEPPRPDAATLQRQAEADARREAERRAAQRAAEQKAAADKAAAQKAAAERAAAERRAAEKRGADKATAEKAAADKRAAAEEKLRAEREAELRRQLAAEENAQRARASGQGAAWAAAIQARIQRVWIRPESARAGLDCTVIVNQVPGGEVTGVRIGACNGDDVVRQSIEAAVYRASPLPQPPDPALFERTIEVRFKPNE